MARKVTPVHSKATGDSSKSSSSSTKHPESTNEFGRTQAEQAEFDVQQVGNDKIMKTLDASVQAEMNLRQDDATPSITPMTTAEVEAAYQEHDEVMMRRFGPRPAKDETIIPMVGDVIKKVVNTTEEKVKETAQAANETFKEATQPKETIDMKEPSLLTKMLVTGVLVAILMLASYAFVAAGISFANPIVTAFVLMAFGSVTTVFYMGVINKFATYVDSKIDAVKSYFAKRKAAKAVQRTADQAAAMKDLNDRLNEQGLAGV